MALLVFVFIIVLLAGVPVFIALAGSSLLYTHFIAAIPDFVVLHPRRGVLILEVKDWKIDTIKSMDRASCTLLTNRGLTTVANPLSQARVYALEVAVALGCFMSP